MYRKCLAFVLGPILAREIEEFKTLWNTHRIRHNKHSGTPHGIPNDLYLLPSSGNYNNKSNSVWVIPCQINTKKTRPPQIFTKFGVKRTLVEKIQNPKFQLRGRLISFFVVT